MALSTLVLYADTVTYCNAGNQVATGYYAVAKWLASKDYKAGAIVRQAATPALNNERCFVCLTDGMSGGSEPAWGLTRGAKTTGGVTWQECTGVSAVNGDFANTPTWVYAANNLNGRKIALGQVIRFLNPAAPADASYQICSTAGVAGPFEPPFSKIAGAATGDGTVVWTSLGLVSSFVKGGAPHARIANAGVEHWFYGGGTIFIGDNHAESQSADLTFFTTYQSTDPLTISRMLCHDHAGSYPPADTDLRSSATVATPNNGISFTPGGSFYVYGVTFKIGESYTGYAPINIAVQPLVGSVLGSSIARQHWVMFDRCSFWFMQVNASGVLAFGSAYIFAVRIYSVVIFNNTTLNLKTPSVHISPIITRFVWRNTGPILEPGSVVPTYLLSSSGLDGCFYDTLFEACDLGQLSTKIFARDFWQQASLVLKDCKMHQAATFDWTPADVGMIIQLARCDSEIATYRSDRLVYEGHDTTEIVITRAGGAVDPNGQPQTRRLTSTAGAAWVRPLQASPYAIWNSVVGAPVVLTVYGLADNATAVMNDDIWLEVVYLADPASTLGTMITTSKATIASPSVAVPTDSSMWNAVSGAVFDAANSTWLSNGNRTATLDYMGTFAISGFGTARNLAFQADGNYYFEFTIVRNNGGYSSVGIMSSSGNFDFFYGMSSYGMDVQLDSGAIRANGTYTGRSVGKFKPGDVAGVAVNVNHQGWIRRNNGPWNGSPTANPSSGSGGVAIAPSSGVAPAAMFAGSLAGDAITLNCGSERYAAAPPASYQNWPGAARWSPFKLVATVTPALPGYIHVRPMVGKPFATFFLDPQIVVG